MNQGAFLRVHRGTAQLRSRHFAQPFESAYFDLFGRIKHVRKQLGSMGFVTGIVCGSGLGNPKEWRLCQIQAPLFDERAHL